MDATLIEVNPLGLLSNSLMALDSKVLLDDSAEYRKRDRISSYKEQREKFLSKKRTKAEKMARDRGLSYVEMDGNIGLISDGAGTGMLTLDVIKDFGGKPADFCEMGGEADATIMEETMEVVMANHKVEGLLITLIGGLTRMDEIAEGIANYLKKNDTTIPLAIRMCGTKEKVGKEILEDIGLQTFDDHQEAVKSIVKKVDKG
jgi:succinyl-CoA synthetase beta subunit